MVTCERKRHRWGWDLDSSISLWDRLLPAVYRLWKRYLTSPHCKVEKLML